MKQIRINISLFLVIPVIFAGIAVLAAIVTYQIGVFYFGKGENPYQITLIWIAIIAAAAAAIGYLIVRLLLEPAAAFMEKAKELPVFSATDVNVPERQVDRLEHYSRVFQQMTTALSKVDVRQLFPDLIGESRAMRGVLSHVMKVAPLDSTVLIIGESGTGKELVAMSIFEHSRRQNKPFVKLNCAAIPEGLLESELFGYEKGAFTGASASKKGKFEMADGGTLFLDEIGDMPLSTQAKVLRILQEKEFERVGGNKNIKVDVRFIAATNKNLEKMVENGQFREDLFFRLNVFSLFIPPVRERAEDIPLLVNHFLQTAPRAVKISAEALQALMAWTWPGNVRELQNAIERAAVLCEGDQIEPVHLPVNISQTPRIKRSADVETDESVTIDDRLNEMELSMILDALHQAGGIQVKAAKILGINQRSLWHRIKKHNIDVQSIKNT